MEGRLFLLGVIAFASGIICRSFFIYPWMFFAVIAMCGLIMVTAFWATHRRWYGLFALMLLMFSIGAVRTAFAPVTPPPAWQSLFTTEIDIEGQVIRDPDVRETNQRIAIEAVTRDTRMRFLAVAPLFETYSYGERVRVQGTLEAPKPFDTDGGRSFAYDTFLAKDGIFGIVNEATINHVGPPHGMWAMFQGGLFSIAHTFEQSLARALPEPYAGLAEGLIAGGKQGLGKDLEDAFTVAGLLPIIVLSGYNVMIIAEAILNGLSFLPKRAAVIIAAISIGGFVLAAGGGSSALRAGLMAGLALFARATGRTYNVMRALGVVFVAMLLWDPLLLLYDPGFQFSFMATIGLILGTPIVEMRLQWIRAAVLRDVASTTIAAQAAVLPILLYQTGNLSLVSVPANILILPIVPLTMLLSFLAGLVALVVPVLAPLAGLPAFALLWYIVLVATLAARIPLAQVIVPTFSFVFVIVLYGILGFFVWNAKRKAPTPLGVGALPNTSSARLTTSSRSRTVRSPKSN